MIMRVTLLKRANRRWRILQKVGYTIDITKIQSV